MDFYSQNGIAALVFSLQRRSGAVAVAHHDRFAPCGAAWGLLVAPPDFRQGNSYRIIYIHVPAAVVALAGYYVMAFAGAVSLIWRIKMADVTMRAAAPVGAVLTAVALVTGAIWGKPTWGTWWVWDARITSMLILLFLYLGVVALFEAYENKTAAARACACCRSWVPSTFRSSISRWIGGTPPPTRFNKIHW